MTEKKLILQWGEISTRKNVKLLSDKSLRYAYKRKIFKDFSTTQGGFTCQKLEKAHRFSDNNL